MEDERVKSMLMAFSQGKKITDVVLRSKDFSNDEIGQVEKLGYIDCVETNAWGDRVYTINDSGMLFTDREIAPK